MVESNIKADGAVMEGFLVQEHIDTQLRGAGDRTSNLKLQVNQIYLLN